MDATVAIAALGFASTLFAAWLTAHWQTRGLVRTDWAMDRLNTILAGVRDEFDGLPLG